MKLVDAYQGQCGANSVSDQFVGDVLDHVTLAVITFVRSAQHSSMYLFDTIKTNIVIISLNWRSLFLDRMNCGCFSALSIYLCSKYLVFVL